MKKVILSVFLVFWGTFYFSVVFSETHEKGTAFGRGSFEKAFKEVAYAYYMRGPYLNYNDSKGKGIYLSPEESTSQDFHYLACGQYVLNVYKELLGIKLSSSDSAYWNYAKTYVGKRKEVVGYGELQANGDLYWFDGTKNNNQLNIIKNPSRSYIISQLKIGDILGYNGHVMLVYDLIRDAHNNVVDVYLINATSSGGGSYYTRSKNHFLSAYIYDVNKKKVPLILGHAPWSSLYYNNRDRRGVYNESLVEGTVTLETFTERAERDGLLLFDKSDRRNITKAYYSILRFVDADRTGNEVLNFDGKYRKFQGETIDNRKFDYSDNVKSRLKFSKLYIEKTVDKKDNNVVEENDELTYKIVVQNCSGRNYENDIKITEYLSEHVNYLSCKTSSNIKGNTKQAAFKNDNGNLEWNIGKLKSGEKVTLYYKVKVKANSKGCLIKSIGKVDNIPSGTVKNRIGKNLTKEQQKRIIEKYEALKNQYTGMSLINEIYKEACGIDLGLEFFNIKANSKEDEAGLIYFNQKWGSGDWNEETYMSISKRNVFSNMVLNSYFNALYENPSKIKSYNGIDVRIYAIPSIGLRTNDPDERANTIFPTDFKTGDILIYTNSNDKTYSTEKGTYNTKERYVTYEDGEYCYIYIRGKGFVGVNFGNDGIAGTRDDRNDFSLKYYKDNGLSAYSKIGLPVEMTNELEEWLQYQSLFGKDYYVILRPSLSGRF